jgi:hypothetical protein
MRRTIILSGILLALVLSCAVTELRADNITLPVTIRDFKAGIDFENAVISDDRGIVRNILGSDNKPVYAHQTGTTVTTHGASYFNRWYNDVSGVNVDIPCTITLSNSVENPDIYTCDYPYFFPIDGKGFGNSGTADDGKYHNFSFTTEVHTRFTFSGTESFSFRGLPITPFLYL